MTVDINWETAVRFNGERAARPYRWTRSSVEDWCDIKRHGQRARTWIVSMLLWPAVIGLGGLWFYLGNTAGAFVMFIGLIFMVTAPFLQLGYAVNEWRDARAAERHFSAQYKFSPYLNPPSPDAIAYVEALPDARHFSNEQGAFDRYLEARIREATILRPARRRRRRRGLILAVCVVLVGLLYESALPGLRLPLVLQPYAERIKLEVEAPAYIRAASWKTDMADLRQTGLWLCEQEYPDGMKLGHDWLVRAVAAGKQQLAEKNHRVTRAERYSLARTAFDVGEDAVFGECGQSFNARQARQYLRDSIAFATQIHGAPSRWKLAAMQTTARLQLDHLDRTHP